MDHQKHFTFMGVMKENQRNLHDQHMFEIQLNTFVNKNSHSYIGYILFSQNPRENPRFSRGAPIPQGCGTLDKHFAELDREGKRP